MVTVYVHKAPKIIDKLQRVESVDIHLSAHETTQLRVDLMLLQDFLDTYSNGTIFSVDILKKLEEQLNEKESSKEERS